MDETERSGGALLGGRNGKKRTYGLMTVVHPDPRSGREGGSGTTRPYEGRSGVWNDKSAPLGGRNVKKRTYDLTTLIYPDLRTRGEKGPAPVKGALARQDEPCLVEGRLPKSPISGREGGLERRSGKRRTYACLVGEVEKADLRPDDFVYPNPRTPGKKGGLQRHEELCLVNEAEKADLQPYGVGHLPRPPISGRDGGSGTT